MTAIGKTHSHSLGRVLFCRMPGLLSSAARSEKKVAAPVPVVVADGKRVRDACPFSLGRGIYAGQSISQTRRLCPTLQKK